MGLDLNLGKYGLLHVALSLFFSFHKILPHICTFYRLSVEENCANSTLNQQSRDSYVCPVFCQWCCIHPPFSPEPIWIELPVWNLRSVEIDKILLMQPVIWCVDVLIFFAYQRADGLTVIRSQSPSASLILIKLSGTLFCNPQSGQMEISIR